MWQSWIVPAGKEKGQIGEICPFLDFPVTVVLLVFLELVFPDVFIAIVIVHQVLHAI